MGQAARRAGPRPHRTRESAMGEDTPNAPAQRPRPRVREVGLVIGLLPPGANNAITDVADVQVGQQTLIEENNIRTGVTAILPHAGNLFQEKVPAAMVVGNGFGKLIGFTQVAELGVIETPIVLTNTLSAFAAADAVASYVLRQAGNDGVLSVNPIVGECNDGYLNDIRAQHIRREHVWQAITAARGGPVDEGSVGAGTGMRCLGWKGGIGTSSRLLPQTLGGWQLGVLVQTNFNGVLTVAGVPVGPELGRYLFRDTLEPKSSEEQGSCLVVVATDAPLDSRQLRRLGSRALLGLAAVGSPMTHGSGEYVIAFSTARDLRTAHESQNRTQTQTMVRDETLSLLFQAAREATEEAVLNSMFRATTLTGFQGRTVEAIPIDQVVAVCRRYGRIEP